MNELTAKDALKLLKDRVQWMREGGESDLRSLLYFISGIVSDIEKGMPREQIISDRADES